MEAAIEKPELKIYSDYKDSGVNWIDEIPEHWKLLRANYIFEKIDLRSKEGDEELLTVSEHHGVKKRSESNVNMFMAESYKGYKICYPNDLVINSLWAWSRGLGFSNLHGIVSTAYSVFRPDLKNYNVNFLNYLLRTDQYVAEYLRISKGVWISRLQLSDWAFLRIPIISPPLEEQTRIANFLDKKTEQIDKAIAQKQKLIELLKEKRQIMIHKAVTRGLNPDVPMKDSGVEWIGEIPKHWEVMKLKYLCTYFKGHAFKSIFYKDNGIPIIKASNLKNTSIYNPDSFIDPLQFKSEYNKVILYKGDIIISTVGSKPEITNSAVGQMAQVNTEFHNSLLNQNTACLRPNQYIHQGFLFFALLSAYMKFRFKTISLWIANQAYIEIESVLDSPLALPPLNEQKEIHSYIKTISKKISSSIQQSEEQINKLLEFKSVLINSAVTGKIKV